VVLFYQDNIVARELRDQGIRVIIMEGQRALERRVNLVGSRFQRIVKMARAVLWRRALLRSEGIGLVHLNDSPQVGNDDWLPAARLLGIPCITSARYDAGGERHWIRRLLFRGFDRVLANSEFTMRQLLREGIPPTSLQRIYPGLDVDRFRDRVKRSRASVRASLHLADDILVVAMVANVRQWKGQHIVLEALSMVPRSILMTMHVLFIGDTAPEDREYRASLMRMVDQSHLGAYVTFLGFRRDVPDLVNASDVVVHASITPEPFGRVLPEAMALGKVVLATSAGGPLEILTPESGVLFDPRRPAELSARLVELVSNPVARGMLGAGALDRVESFRLDASIEQTMAAYTRAVNARSMRAHR
jgi:glycosyltransferase involved in cell wall biosynthesis